MWGGIEMKYDISRYYRGLVSVDGTIHYPAAPSTLVGLVKIERADVLDRYAS
jgi:hypothetical protein